MLYFFRMVESILLKSEEVEEMLKNYVGPLSREEKSKEIVLLQLLNVNYRQLEVTYLKEKKAELEYLIDWILLEISKDYVERLGLEIYEMSQQEFGKISSTHFDQMISIKHWKLKARLIQTLMEHFDDKKAN